jgi:hypothetical protein
VSISAILGHGMREKMSVSEPWACGMNTNNARYYGKKDAIKRKVN